MRADLPAWALVCLSLTTPGWADIPPPPEAASSYQSKPLVQSRRQMVVTANPHATRAALEILGAGGSAVDAAIAAQMVLGLVEPQSSGLGGGGLMLSFAAGEGRLRAYDGRETAPSGAGAGRFVDATGSVLGFGEAVRDARAVGVPGLLAMLELAHADGGRLPWRRLFEPAIRLAREGFVVSPRLHRLLEIEGRFADPVAQRYFFDGGGQPWPVGHRLRNPALADILAEVARDGAEAFYRGPRAQAIRDAVRGPVGDADADGQGLLGEGDLRDYRALRRDALCRPFLTYSVCGFPPPSSGASTVLAILGVWQSFPAPRPAPLSAEFVHRFAEAARLAYADRNACVGDPDFVAVPLGQMLDAAYLGRRAALIRADGSLGRANSGVRCGGLPGEVAEPAGTTHLSIVDRRGNGVALTSSIESAFGNRRMVAGFLLNNQLTDFSLEGPNRAEPGKRPRSAMAPSLVFDQRGHLHAVLGSPGGSQIPNYVAQALIGLLDAGQSPDEVAAQAHVGSRNGPTELEAGRDLESLASVLATRGHALRVGDMTSGLAIILRHKDRWLGAADPRREGLAAGAFRPGRRD